MAKGFPYFKFVATEWLTGDIVYEELSVQGLFINVCALYWQREGKLTIEDIVKRYKNPPELAELNGRYFSVTDGFISIKFLDEQFEDVVYISETNSKNGQKGGKKKATNRLATDNQPLNDGLPVDKPPLATASQSPSELYQRRKEEDKNKNKNKEDNTGLLPQSTRPTIEEFLEYCKTLVNGKYQAYEFSLRAKYEAWVDNKWKDGHNAAIKNWKLKIMNTLPHLGMMPVDVTYQPTVIAQKTEAEKQAEIDEWLNS